MLLPKEKPYLQGLNSFYLHLDKLLEHLQGDIGCGCLHGKSPAGELLLYFDETEIIQSLIRERTNALVAHPEKGYTASFFAQNSLVVNVYALDPNAIYYWAQMPQYQRAKSTLRSAEIPLPDLIFRLRRKNFSGFIDVRIVEKNDAGLLFFNEGVRIGGSFSWGRGGMSRREEDYTILLSKIQAGEGIFTFGAFNKPSISLGSQAGDNQARQAAREQVPT